MPLEANTVLVVIADLMFTVKINEAAKRAGMPAVFVKSEIDALEKAATDPALIIVDLNCATIDVLSLIRKLKSDDATKKISLIGYEIGRAHV